MPERRQKAERAARWTFRRHFLWPLAALIGTLGLSLFGSVSWLTQQQDQLQLNAERTQVRMAVLSRLEAMRRNLADYAVWDDAVRNLVIRFDVSWAEENIAPYLYRIQQYDYVAVIDGRGRLLIASEGPRLSTKPPTAKLGSPFVDALRQLRAGPSGSDRRLVGLTEIEGKPALFGLAAIVPSGSARLPAGPDSFVIVARILNPSTLADLGAEFGIEALHEDSRHQESHLDLIAAGRGIVGSLGWESASPGTVLRQRATPFLVLISLLMGAIGLAILHHARGALINAILAQQEAEFEIAHAQETQHQLDLTRRQMADEADEARATLQQTVARIEAEHEQLIQVTLTQRRDELIRFGEDYQRAVKLVLDTLEEAAESLSDVAGKPCGEISATQLLSAAGDLQAQAQFLDVESRQFLARMRAA